MQSGKVFSQVKKNFLEQLPIPSLFDASQKERIAGLAERLINAHGQDADLLTELENEVAQGFVDGEVAAQKVMPRNADQKAAINEYRAGNTLPRTRRPARADFSQPSFDLDALPVNEGQYLKVAEPRSQYQIGPAHAIVEYLKVYSGWHAKADVLAATGITDGQWNAAIADLIAGGQVKRQGEKRGAKYQIVEVSFPNGDDS